jgi:hypothetical protein
LIDIRIYRAFSVLTLLTLVVVMFSLQERPSALTSTLAPDAFDARGAYGTLGEITERYPDRRPGSEADRALGTMAESRLKDLGYETSRDQFSAEADDESVPMENVTGVLSGPSDRQVVVLAHRDSSERPGGSSAASTAVLLELARAVAAVRHSKTFLFASIDGGEADSAGSRRFASHYAEKGKVEAVLVLDDLAAAHLRRPYLVPWSTNSRRGSLQLLRTADAALERELGTGGGSQSAFGQFVRQAWPLTLREQGPLVSAGLDAVTMTARGEVPRSAGSDSLDGISRVFLLGFGKAALSTVLALDSAPRLERSPSGYVVLGRQLLPKWAVSLLVLGLLIPPFAAAVDGFARARRRGHPILHWIRWTLAAGVPFLVVSVAAQALQLVEWLPDTSSAALAPVTRSSFAEAAPAVGALALLFALSWWVVRRRLAGGEVKLGKPDAPEAAVALTLVLSVGLLLVWSGNPFAALLLIPVLHLCLLTALPEGPNRRLLLAGTVAAALLLPAIVLLYYGTRLDMGLDPTRYVLLLIAGEGSVWGVMLRSLVAGSLVLAVFIALARTEPERPTEITVRGPSTYAGPGSLGGTRSALRR